MSMQRVERITSVRLVQKHNSLWRNQNLILSIEASLRTITQNSSLSLGKYSWKYNICHDGISGKPEVQNKKAYQKCFQENSKYWYKLTIFQGHYLENHKIDINWWIGINFPKQLLELWNVCYRLFNYFIIALMACSCIQSIMIIFKISEISFILC